MFFVLPYKVVCEILDYQSLLLQYTTKVCTNGSLKSQLKWIHNKPDLLLYMAKSKDKALDVLIPSIILSIELASENGILFRAVYFKLYMIKS